MSKSLYQIIVSYEAAQKLIPIFEYYKKKGPWKEVRGDADAILRNLRLVRQMDYSPMSGEQLFLTESQYDFYNDVVSEVGI